MKSIIFYLLLSLSFYSSFSNAATLKISGGELVGATEIIIDGIKYDVEFISQNCLGLFSGCTNFLFSSEALASTASMALEQQVFNDIDPTHLNYDTNPQFTTNITSSIEGFFLTPYMRVGPNGRDVLSSAFVNGTGIIDSLQIIQQAKGARPFGWGTYAYWTLTPVPLPTAVWLFGSGLLGLLGLSKRKKAKAQAVRAL